MSDGPIVEGRFQRDPLLPQGVSNAQLIGRGSVRWTGDGLAIAARVKRGWLTWLLGVPAVLVALVGTALLTVAVEGMGLDLMGARKGPVLVAMIALVAMFAAWGAADWIASLLPGSPVTVRVPRPDVRAFGPTEAGPVLVTWASGDLVVGTALDTDDGQAEAVHELAQRIGSG